jgi:hypothetical protein
VALQLGLLASNICAFDFPSRLVFLYFVIVVTMFVM